VGNGQKCLFCLVFCRNGRFPREIARERDPPVLLDGRRFSVAGRRRVFAGQRVSAAGRRAFLAGRRAFCADQGVFVAGSASFKEWLSGKTCFLGAQCEIGAGRRGGICHERPGDCIFSRYLMSLNSCGIDGMSDFKPMKSGPVGNPHSTLAPARSP
jgi:hypothetical protein